MTRKYFGTDGVRGRVGETPITPDFVMKLGQAAGRVLRRRIDGRRHVRVVIGKDTRVSGYMLEAALQAGFSSAGVDVAKKSWTRAFPVWTAANWVRLGGLKMLRVDTSNFVNPRLTAQSI